MASEKSGKVRISMSAEVANNLEAFKKGVVQFAEEIGCPNCFSGLDCTFESEREFAIGPKYNVRRATPAHERAVRGFGTREISVPMTTEASFDLKFVLKQIDIFGKRVGQHWEDGGMAWCCSGYDMRFERETLIREPAI